MLPLRAKATILKRKRTLVRTDAVPRTIKDHKVFEKIGIYVSTHINTDGEEETRKFRMGRGQRVTDICYRWLEH